MPKAKIELIDFQDSLYKDFEAKTNKCVFYSNEWLKTLTNSYKYKLKLLKIDDRERGESFIPFMVVRNVKFQKRLVSVPFSDETQVVDLGLGKEIMAYLESHLKDYKEIEIKSRLEGENWQYEEGNFSYILELEGTEEELFNKFHKTRVKQVVRKAEKNNLEVILNNSKEVLQKFYELHSLTRRRLGVPVQPFNFFENLWQNILSQDKGFVCVIQDKGKPISGSVFLTYKDTVTYKFSASHPDFLNLKPNHLMLWEGIKKALREDFKYFDFGKCEESNSGLRAFKRGWNSIETPIAYSILSNKRIEREAIPVSDNSLVKKVVNNTPQSMQKFLSYLYKYFG